MDKTKRVQIVNNKTKRIQEEMTTREFFGDDEVYADLETQLERALEKLEREKAK